MSSECVFCKGKLEKKRITYPTQYNGRVIVVTNVPALVCKQCGEKLFEPSVVEKLQKIVWGEVPNHETVAVDTYDFAEVA